MSIELSKRETAVLRDLANEAWEAELHEQLGNLFEEFYRWADNGCSSWDVVASLQTFHDGGAHQFYRRCTGVLPAVAVARAIVVGPIDESELPAELLGKLQAEIDVQRRLNDAWRTYRASQPILCTAPDPAAIAPLYAGAEMARRADRCEQVEQARRTTQ